MSSTARKTNTATDTGMDEVERLDQEARRRAQATVKARRLHTAAPHNMDGKNDGRTQLDDDPETRAVGERGGATYIIIQTMLAGPCTREDLLNALRKEFPNHEDDTLKNTLGSLMHSIPKRRGWVIKKTRDPKDSRRPIYEVVDKGIDADEYKEKAGDNRIRVHSQEGAHTQLA